MHPNATLAADGMLAEALQMVEDGDTRVLENVSAAAIDPTPAERPQHKRRRGRPVSDAVLAGFIPYAGDGFVASLRRRYRSPPSAKLLPPML